MNYSDLKDIQSESGIIATLIQEPGMVSFSEELTSQCFVDTVNGILYDVIKSLYESGITHIDAFNMYTTINSVPSFKSRVNGTLTQQILEEIIANSKFISRDTVTEYKKLVANVMNMAYRRKMYDELSRAQTACLKSSDVISLQKSVYENIEKITGEFITGNEIPSLGSQIESLWEQTKSRQNNGACGYTTLFPELNKYLTFEKGELITFAAPYKTGKSMFLMNTGVDLVLNQGASVLYWDSEMSDRLFSERLIALLSQVKMSDIKTGTYTREEEGKIKKAIEIIKNMPFYHKYIPAYSMDAMYATTRSMHNRGMADVVIFDYLKSKDSQDASGAYFELGALVDLLKNSVAGGLDIPVITAAQLNRKMGIADSIKIAQFSSAIVKLQRKTEEEIMMDGEECGNYKMTVQANRLGDQQVEGEDWIDLNFFGQYCLFEQAPSQHEKRILFQ